MTNFIVLILNFFIIKLKFDYLIKLTYFKNLSFVYLINNFIIVFQINKIIIKFTGKYC